MVAGSSSRRARRLLTVDLTNQPTLPAAAPLPARILSRDTIPYWIAVALLMAFSIPWMFHNPINGDTGFFAYSGNLLLSGTRLYRDIVEPNTPPPYLFGAVCSALGRLVGLAPEPAFILVMTFIIVLVIYRTYRILSRLFPAQPYAGPFLTVVVTYCLLPYVNEMFGEREHIFTCMILPWLFGSISDCEVRSKKEQIVDGIMAGIGIAMKPFFIAAFCAVQLINLTSSRRRAQLLRLDNVLIIATQIAVVVVTIALFPGYLFVLRMALATYHSFRQSLLTLCLNGTFLLLAAASLLSLNSEPRRPFSTMRNLILAVGWAMAMMMLYQREGFGYHYYPLGVMAILALATLLLDGITSMGHSGQRYIAYALIAALVALGTEQGIRPREMPKMTGPLLPVVKREAYGKPVLVLATSLWVSSPLINYAGASSTWRFRSMWTLGGLYSEKPAADDSHPYRFRQEMSEYERFLIDSLNDDVDRHPPQLIIVEVGDQKEGFRGGEFDYLDYFLRDDRFARFFSKYEEIGAITRYKLYRRH